MQKVRVDLEGLQERFAKTFVQPVALQNECLVPNLEQDRKRDDSLLLALLIVFQQVVHFAIFYHLGPLRVLTKVNEKLLVSDFEGIVRRQVLLILNELIIIRAVCFTEELVGDHLDLLIFHLLVEQVGDHCLDLVNTFHFFPLFIFTIHKLDMC